MSGGTRAGARGVALLEDPLANNGTAFGAAERRELGLDGLLPPVVETLEQQVARAYEAFGAYRDDLAKHVYLRGLQDTNEVLFYKLLVEHVEELLPVVLDVGTNNQERLDDPEYLGWRHERIAGDDYFDFVDRFVAAVERELPGTLLQWEDFATAHARPILERYRDRLLTFNDDIQGTAAVAAGAFTEPIVRQMAARTRRPIIFPLSNPTARSEADPADLARWTDGRALVATGSPYPPLEIAGKRLPVAQCNNVFVFPAVGLGVVASRARRVTDGMLEAAARARRAVAGAHRPAGVAAAAGRSAPGDRPAIAAAVAAAAVHDGVAPPARDDELHARVAASQWRPEYR